MIGWSAEESRDHWLFLELFLDFYFKKEEEANIKSVPVLCQDQFFFFLKKVGINTEYTNFVAENKKY